MNPSNKETQLEQTLRAQTNILKLLSETKTEADAQTAADKIIEFAIKEGKNQEDTIRILHDQALFLDYATSRVTPHPNQNPAERPLMYLRELMRDMPHLSDLVNSAMELREDIDRKTWPEWCFIPQGAWAMILNMVLNKSPKTKINEKIEDLTLRLATVGAWRYGQGVYSFEPEIYNALLESDIPKILPSNILLRLPEWCLYIPTPGMHYHGYNIYGFFASLDITDNKEKNGVTPDLYLTLDTRHGLNRVQIPLTDENLMSMLDSLIKKERNNTHKKSIADSLGGEEFIKTSIMEIITPLISLLLYICGNEPEIDNNKKPGTSPSKPQGRKIKGTYKVFPASNPVVWTIGKKISETLRNIDREYRGGSKIGGKKRPHLRKGHHNYYWTGPRNTEQTQILKWIPPKLVAQRIEENIEKNDKTTENTPDDA